MKIQIVHLLLTLAIIAGWILISLIAITQYRHAKRRKRSQINSLVCPKCGTFGKLTVESDYIQTLFGGRYQVYKRCSQCKHEYDKQVTTGMEKIKRI